MHTFISGDATRAVLKISTPAGLQQGSAVGLVDGLTCAGFPVKVCCRTLGVSRPGYNSYRQRPLAPTKIRREWLTSLIREVHLASRGTYGSRRVRAELTKGLGVFVSERLVAVLMHHAGIYGLPGPARVERLRRAS